MNSTVWRLMSYHIVEDKDAALRWALDNERICIGWGTIGDIRAQSYNSSQQISDAIRYQFALGNHPFTNYKSGGDSLWALYHEVQVGDLVILKGGTYSKVFRVEGDYEFRNRSSQIPFPDYFHQRHATVLHRTDPQKLWESAGRMFPDGGSIYRTMVRCAKPVETPCENVIEVSSKEGLTSPTQTIKKPSQWWRR